MLLSTNVGISWSTFPKAGSTEADQLSAQLDVCAMVTSEMDSIANQILRATIDTEDEFGPDYIITIQPNGWARFRFPWSPIIGIVGGQWCSAATTPPTWTAIPSSQIVTEHAVVTATGTSVPTGSTGPSSVLISPQSGVNWSNGRKGFRVQVTAITGFPVAGIDTAVSGGATSIHVDDITGWWNGTAGARGTIYDPPWRESVTAAGVTPDTPGAISGPGTIALVTPLRFDHTPTVGNASLPDQKIVFSAMSPGLIMAGYYLATHFGLIRGSTAAVMQSGRGQIVSKQGSPQGWYEMAERQIARYARVL